MSGDQTREHCADFEPLIPAELVVRDPEICSGRPTMKGTRILAENVHRELAGGMSWMEILEWWPSIPVPAAQEGRGAPQAPGPETDRGTGEREPHARPEGHWLKFNNGEIVGCQCGVPADYDSDCGWGDSVVAHLIEVGADAARPVHLREAAQSLHAIAQARLADAPDPVAVARALGIEDAAHLIESTARDLTEETP